MTMVRKIMRCKTLNYISSARRLRARALQSDRSDEPEHADQADGDAPRGFGRRRMRKTFRQQLLDDEKDHRASSEPETRRQQRLKDGYEQECRHRDDGLRQAGENGVRNASRDRSTICSQRQRDRRSLWNVMHSNGDRQKPAELDLAGRITNAN